MIEDKITFAAAREFIDYVRTRISNIVYDQELSQGLIGHYLHADDGRLIQVILIETVNLSLKMNLYSATKSPHPFIGIEVSGAAVVVTQAGIIRTIKSDDLVSEIIIFANALKRHLLERKQH
jgi:hypothetical protein